MIQEHDPDQVCILWHQADKAPAETLIRALTKRGLCVMPTTSFHTVFAAACRCAKASERVVIVLDDRNALSGVDRVLDGLERFAPGVICWEHRAGANPPMVPVVQTVVQPTVQEVQAPSEPITNRKPTTGKLRLVGDNKSPARKPIVSIPTTPASGTISSSDVLNADELDALLASEIGNGRNRK